MVARGGALVQIVSHHEAGICQGEFAAVGGAHDANAPVKVGRKAEVQVVRRFLRDVAAGEECLMAYQHAALERPPREARGRREAAAVQEIAGGIDDVRVAVNHGRQLVALFCHGGNLRKRVGRVETVAGVEKQQIFARGEFQAFVHGIVNTSVGLAAAYYFARVLRATVAFLIMMDFRKCAVLRIAVDNNVFHGIVGLFLHAANRSCNKVGGVVGNGDDRYFKRRLHYWVIIFYLSMPL